jgi:ferric-dicitrate binding protein FerR (iron transport regulator)
MNEASSDERDVTALLRAVGARPTAPASDMEEVRAAVAAEWRATVATRQRQQKVRRFTGWAAAASVAVAAFGVWLARPLVQPGPQVVASLARVVGTVEQNRGDGRWTPVASAGAIESGTRLRTTGDGRAALRLASGIELRLDARTLVALTDGSHATLANGAVYVDAGRPSGTPGPEFDLATPAGTLSHLGTQYTARIADHGVLVGVREGRVRLSTDQGDVIGSAGEQLTVAGGTVSRAPLASTAATWDWVGSVTPPFDIEGHTVESFLVWAARETGRTVVYASPEAAQQARSVTLRGTVAGLTPDEAVQAVLSTTSLQPQIQAEHIRIESNAR